MKKCNNGVKIGLLIIIGLLFWGTAQADVTFSIRHEDNVFFEGTSTLTGGDMVLSTELLETLSVDERTISADSVLGVLSEIDATEPGFSISALTYYPLFSPPSFLLDCITVGSTDACYNWQYVVNGVYPDVGMNVTTLVDGDSVYIYYGPSSRISLSSSNVYVGEEFEVTVQDYQYTNNTWGVLNGVTVGVTQPDPDNPWSPIEIATQTVNGEGVATFQISAAGSYNIGIQEDFYFPTVALSVQAPASNGGGGGVVVSHKTLNVNKAIDFLSLHQKENGSVLDSVLLSDWTALAFGAYEGVNFGKEALRDYLLSDPNPGSSVTDYERRAMALMAFEINPYSGTDTNYIAKILDSFDGKQFGNPEFVNDDIFALLVLLRSGYTDSDEVIQGAVSFVVSAQWEDGSWDGVDMTAAAVQALSLVPSINSVPFALNEATAYLKQAQEKTGGFGNVFSTSWVLQALHVLLQDEIWWQKDDNTPGDYLYSTQAEDGGVNESDTLSNRIWATAYAIPATMGKPWGDILSSFSKPTTTEEIFVFIEETQETSVSNERILLRIGQELDVISGKVAILEQEVQLLLDASSARYLAETEQVILVKEQKQEKEVLLAGITVLPDPDVFMAAAVSSTGIFSRGMAAAILIWVVRIAAVLFFFRIVFSIGRTYAARNMSVDEF